jgi:phosphoglycerate dehydrogenase-like enzyme
VHNLVGARLGVLGYGSIGRQVARLGSALGMAVIAYTASPRPTPDSRRDRGFIVPGTGDPTGELPVEWFSGVGREPLHAFLAADLDVLVVSVPLTEATRGLLGADEFAILARRNAFVTNISRGGILDQDALIEALRAYVADGDGDTRRGLKGAALDVTSPEPLPRESPLWDAPNCIVTPHISGLGTEYLDRSLQVLEVNLERRERGVELINVVDRKKGY